jgi:hypothetical protein
LKRESRVLISSNLKFLQFFEWKNSTKKNSKTLFCCLSLFIIGVENCTFYLGLSCYSIIINIGHNKDRVTNLCDKKVRLESAFITFISDLLKRKILAEWVETWMPPKKVNVFSLRVLVFGYISFCYLYSVKT